MSLFVKTRSFLRNIFSSRRVGADLDQEVHSHLDMLTDENLRAGMSPAEAQRAARIELGGIEQLKEQVREQRLGTGSPPSSPIVASPSANSANPPASPPWPSLTLALGIGANTTIFSLLDPLLLHTGSSRSKSHDVLVKLAFAPPGARVHATFSGSWLVRDYA